MNTFKSPLGHLETQVVCQQVGFLLQRVLWRHHQPHLIESGERPQLPCQCDVSYVDGVERSPVKSNLHLSWRKTVSGSIVIDSLLIDRFEEVFHQLQGLRLGLIQLVVHHDMVELWGEGHLVLSLGQAVLYGFRSVSATPF